MKFNTQVLPDYYYFFFFPFRTLSSDVNKFTSSALSSGGLDALHRPDAEADDGGGPALSLSQIQLKYNLKFQIQLKYNLKIQIYLNYCSVL